MQEVVETGNKVRTKLYGKLLSLARVTQIYSDRPKCLKAVIRILCNELAELKSTKYPMPESDVNEIKLNVNELKEIARRLVKVKKVEEWNSAVQALQLFTEKIEARLRVSSDSPVENIKNIIGSAVKNAKQLGNAVEIGVNKIKKTVIGEENSQ